MHRFPKPGRTNSLRCELWAKNCFPNELWASPEFHRSLFSQHKMLCSKHFKKTCFVDRKLFRTAIPTEELDEVTNTIDASNLSSVVVPVAGPSRTIEPLSENINILNTLNVPAQHVPSEQKHDASNLSSVFVPVAGPSRTIEPLSENINILNTLNVPAQHVPSEQKHDASNLSNVFVPVAGPSRTIEPLSENINILNTLNVPAQHVPSEQKHDASNLSSVFVPVAGPSRTIEPLSENINILNTLNVPAQHVPSEQKQLEPVAVSPKHAKSERERKLYTKMIRNMKKVCRLQKTIKHLKSVSFVNVLSKDSSINDILKSKVSSTFALLLQGELQNFKRKGKARRWNTEAKITALRLYKKSPTCYKLLRRLICLPAPSTLKTLLNNFFLGVGINKNIFNVLKKTVKTHLPPDREYVLMFDEMSIKKNLWYNPKEDYIEGYQDHDSQGRSPQIASYALVFMVAGIRKPVKQPVAYYLSGGSVTADRLAVILKEVLKSCFDAGLNIAATVCDLNGVNKRAVTILGATVDEPFIKIETNEIVTIFDTPHLLKCFRNLFLKYDIKCQINITSDNKCGVGIAKWSYIQQFYELDNNNPNFVFAPLLKQDHLNPNTKQKMKVKLAAQILSHSVAAGMYAKIAQGELSSDATATADVIAKMDKLFDSVNAYTPDLRRGKPLATNLKDTTGHLSFFKEMKDFFRNLSFLGCRSSPPSKEGWVWTLNGIERLWKNLKTKHKSIKSLSTRRIQQDPLENLFGCIRSNCGSNTNPTTGQFVAGLKTAVLSNLSHAGSGNCEVDENEVILNNFKTLLTPIKVTDTCTATSFDTATLEKEVAANVSSLTLDENMEETTGEMQACAYVCGFIIKNNPNLKCEICKKMFVSDTQEEVHHFIEYKEYDEIKKSLIYASKDIIASVEKSATIINSYLEKEAYTRKIKENIKELLQKSIKWDFLNQCDEHKHYNLYYIINSVFHICVKRFCILRNRQFSEETKMSALKRKIDILKHK